LDTQAVGEGHEAGNSNTATVALDDNDENSGDEPEDLETSLKEREERAILKLRTKKEKFDSELKKELLQLALESVDANKQCLAVEVTYYYEMNELLEAIDENDERLSQHLDAVFAGDETSVAPTNLAVITQQEKQKIDEVKQMKQEHDEETEILENRVKGIEEKMKKLEALRARRLSEFSNREDKVREEFRIERERFHKRQGHDMHSSNRPTTTDTDAGN